MDLINAPTLFPRGLQQIFRYIWDNPGCTRADIERDLYPPNMVSNVVSVRLSQLRRQIAKTKYDLSSQPGPPTGPRRPPNRYKIIKRVPQCQPQLPEQATPTAKSS